MELYQLPKFESPKLKSPKFTKFWQNKFFWQILLIIFISSLCGFLTGAVSGSLFYSEIKDHLAKLETKIPESQIIEKETVKEYQPQTTQEEKIISVVKNVSPAVVSIIITKDVPIIEQYYIGEGWPFFELEIPQYRQQGTEKKEVGGGTGFLVSEEGMILTNKHVVLDTEADYTVFTSDGKKYSAQVLARDPVQDLAILKIEQDKIVNQQGNLVLKEFPTVQLSDSDNLQIGQTVIAIGYALGEFRNTVSVGVISGLGRTITASGGGLVETLEDVIQTDAAINKGNSGGPLLSLKGEVVGINTATVLEAQSIGFAIPVNKVKKDIEQVRALGKIVYPFLGVRYVVINEQIQEENDLPVNYGAWIMQGSEGEPAIFPDSPAEDIGLKEGDIILEFDGKKITTENNLAKIIMEYDPGYEIVLKVLRGEEEKIFQVTLVERSG